MALDNLHDLFYCLHFATSVSKEMEGKGCGMNIEGANSWYLPQKYNSYRKVEIICHGNFWKKITFGYIKQVKLKSLTFKIIFAEF